MTSARPVEHVFFPSFLQNHSQLRRGLELSDPRVFERFLRHEALFSRGLVVADSDLNNNEVFHHAAARKEGLLWTAIQTGFLRRAAREDDRGNRLTQEEVATGLRSSSRWRFDLIPAGYPADLDAAFARAERENPPLVWTLPSVNRVFVGKLLGLLNSADVKLGRDAAQLRLIDVMASWVAEQRRTGTPFGAADVESRLRPRPDSAQIAAWEAVWPVVLQAQANNIPPSFSGKLAVIGVPEANDRMLPAGPESGPEESAIEASIYAGSAAGPGVELEVRRLPGQLPYYDVNEQRLDQLSLEQVEELREEAAPAEFMDRRFRAAGSCEAMAAGVDALRDATATFLERLAAAGVMLTTAAQRSTLRSDIRDSSGAGGAETQIVAFVDSPERIVEYAMMHSFPCPGLGPQVLGCDFTQLIARVEREEARPFYGDVVLTFAYKRPDFRVVELRQGS